MNFRRQSILSIALVTALGAAALPAPAQQPQAQPGAQKAPSADADFVREASAAGLGEIGLSQIASQKATSDDVKNFAGTMITDHTAANQKLATIAQGKGIAVSTEPMKAQAAAANSLKQSQGTQFDAKYISLMKKDHAKAIELFKKEADTGQDPELKAFAAETLPTIEHHADMASKLTPGMKG
jgi:putative membrane protein